MLKEYYVQIIYNQVFFNPLPPFVPIDVFGFIDLAPESWTTFDEKNDIILIEGGYRMKKCYTEPQIVFALQQVEQGTPVSEVIRKMGVSEATFYRWKKKYSGLGVSEIC